MPGPGRGKTKHKHKPKPAKASSSNSAAAPDAFVGDVESAEGWNMVVDVLCTVLEVPDLTTRSGLKKIHADFESIYRRLDRAYTNNSENERIQGGIVGIYAKMCADSLLRNKLFKKGIVSKLVSQLDKPACRHLALQALTTVTRHGGIEARKEIAIQTPSLLKLLREYPDDAKVSQLSVVTLSHSIAAVAIAEPPAELDRKLLKSLNIGAVLELVLENARKPTVSAQLLDHAIPLIAQCTLNCTEAYRSCPSAVTFLVACLRSSEMTVRCTALGGLIRMYSGEAESDQRTLDPMKMVSLLQRGLPESLSVIMMEYGADRTETFITLKTASAYQKAMMKCAQDHDLYALGITLAEFILRTEFSISDGAFEVEDPVTGARTIDDMGLPFKQWSDALPHCAKAIRRKGIASEEDLADVLQLKFLIMRQRIAEAVEYARSALKRSPEVAYFYYVITLTADGPTGLRAAKKGLKCKKTSPFVHFQMMQRAVEHAGDMGVRLLQNSPSDSDRKWDEGVAFLTSALEDARDYVMYAPPDNRHMKNVSYWFILLTLTLKGPDISHDLRELQASFDKLRTADQFSTLMGVPPPKTVMRLAQQNVVKLYPSAIQEWGEVITRYDSLRTAPRDKPILPEKVEDDLASWLQDTHVDDLEKPQCSKTYHSNVELYRCSWCGNPSAVLRKCSGCAKTRYCDGGCQKSHWSDHKKVCTRA